MSKQVSDFSTKTSRPWLTLVILAGALALIFGRSFLPDYVHFSNDGPLGQQNSEWHKLPAAMTGSWYDLNDIGSSVGQMSPTLTNALYLILQPLGYAKYYPMLALFIMGVGVWWFLRSLKLSPLAVTLGTLAAVFDSLFFAGACWSIAAVEIAVGVNFMALALIFSNNSETPRVTWWVRLILAGFCVGMNVMEGSDIGALSSVLVAFFVLYKTWIESDKTPVIRIFSGVLRVAVIAVVAGAIAVQTVVSIVSTQVTGIAGTGQDSETKAAHWDWATQWSVPKRETLSFIIPGLFGYRMDTPKDMSPQFQKYYEGGNYWGGIGRDPNLDRWFDSGRQGPQPQSNFMRFTGGGSYVGILTCLLAAWAVSLAFRRDSSPFTPVQKKIVLFWFVVLVFSLLFAWGRFAPFYAILYQLPYFSTIRNPCKFCLFFCWALTILCAYGIHALSLRNASDKTATTAGPLEHFNQWRARASAFERKWVWASVALLAASVAGWLIFTAEQKSFLAYLEMVGFPDSDPTHKNSGGSIAAFALSQVAWFIPLLALALALLLLFISGYFSGSRAKLGAWALGIFMMFDLVRADLPYVIHWNYKEKYEVGSLNPVVQKLAEKPYEHRVAGLRSESLFENVYRIEWMQHHFPYYNVQCLDIIQMPRLPEDLKMYLEALSPRGAADSSYLVARRWVLSNTRYLLGPANYLESINQQLDPVQRRFSIVQRFDIVPKPGVIQPERLEELTAISRDDGPYALFDFGGALPRAKLYANWQVNTNDQENLKRIGAADFDPAQTVLISTPKSNLPMLSTNVADAGTVEFKSYAPKKIVFAADAKTPSVLLLNDKFDPNWHVTVDGKPADLLRCNFIMRGVQLPPGQHAVEFHYQVPMGPLKITLAATIIAALLAVLLVFLPKKSQTAATT